jgi:hypothetical protein
MKIGFKDTRGNGQRLHDALRAAGHDIEPGRRGDVLLSDHDVRLAPYGALCDAYSRVFVHPHGAGYIASWVNATWRNHPHTRGMFVHGVGQADILRRCGYPLPVEAIGWSFCDTAPFRSSLAPRRVLFAPQHPDHVGELLAELRVENQRILDLLHELPVEVTVREVSPHPLGLSGVWWESQHGNGCVDDAARAVDAFDCVIGAAWTLPCIALARGVPTLMYGQHGYNAWHMVGDRCAQTIPMHPPWSITPDLERYPFDAGAAETPKDLWRLILRVCAGAQSAAKWRERFIGPQMVPAEFVAQFEAAVRDW